MSLLGYKCEGRSSSSDKNYLRLPQLKEIATQLGLTFKSNIKKDQLCQLVRDHLSIHPKDETKLRLNKNRKGFISLDDMMKHYDIDHYSQLIDKNMDKQDIDALLKQIILHHEPDGVDISLYDKLQRNKIYDPNLRAKQLVDTLSGKMCRCIKGISNKNTLSLGSKIAICTNSVINHRGIRQSRHQCKPTPILLPFKDSTYVIKKSPRHDD